MARAMQLPAPWRHVPLDLEASGCGGSGVFSAEAKLKQLEIHRPSEFPTAHSSETSDCHICGWTDLLRQMQVGDMRHTVTFVGVLLRIADCTPAVRWQRCHNELQEQPNAIFSRRLHIAIELT